MQRAVHLPRAAGWPLVTPPRRSRRALTALEVVSALLLTMILSVIGFSGSTIFQRRLPLKSTAKRISSALSTARSFAIARNSFFQVTLDMTNERFWIDEIADPATTPGTVAITPKVVTPDRFDPRVQIDGILDTGGTRLQQAGFQTFVFGPDGSADRDARIFARLRADDPNADESFVTVRLFGPTGHNTVLRGRILPPGMILNDAGEIVADPNAGSGNP